MARKRSWKKKTYNPFKMIGPWIGFGIFFFPISLLTLFTDPGPCNFAVCFNPPDWFLYLVAFILGAVGFLIGWVIQLLTRKIYSLIRRWR